MVSTHFLSLERGQQKGSSTYHAHGLISITLPNSAAETRCHWEGSGWAPLQSQHEPLLEAPSLTCPGQTGSQVGKRESAEQDCWRKTTLCCSHTAVLTKNSRFQTHVIPGVFSFGLTCIPWLSSRWEQDRAVHHCRVHSWHTHWPHFPQVTPSSFPGDVAQQWELWPK